MLHRSGGHAIIARNHVIKTKPVGADGVLVEQDAGALGSTRVVDTNPVIDASERGSVTKTAGLAQLHFRHLDSIRFGAGLQKGTRIDDDDHFLSLRQRQLEQRTTEFGTRAPVECDYSRFRVAAFQEIEHDIGIRFRKVERKAEQPCTGGNEVVGDFWTTPATRIGYWRNELPRVTAPAHRQHRDLTVTFFSDNQVIEGRRGTGWFTCSVSTDQSAFTNVELELTCSTGGDICFDDDQLEISSVCRHSIAVDPNHNVLTCSQADHRIATVGGTIDHLAVAPTAFMHRDAQVHPA